MPSHPPDEEGTVVDQEQPGEATGATLPLPSDASREPASLARIAAGESRGVLPSASFTSAADAMRNEEIERTRVLIASGWVISVIAIGAVPFVEAPRAMAITFVAGLVIGMIISAFLFRRFADPAKYTERALLGLALVCIVNGHIAVLFFGPYTASPMLIVVGIHFVARTELERVARWIIVCASISYMGIAIAIVSGVIEDPGVFAADRTFTRGELGVATMFVLGAYLLSYYTARMFRVASLTSIDELQRATRLASQREALMEELRADLERALQVGGPGRYTDQVIGSYRLGIVLGRGAMGEVYEAAHVETGGQAAVKLLRREMLADSTQLARFMREVKASATLASPNIVTVLATSSESDSLPYLAMERLYGLTLAEQLRNEPKLEPSATYELCLQVGAGIDIARVAGIVHRDLKPQNLFHSVDGTWKILDFGVASLGDHSGTLTQGEAVGTPHYMAPEQAQGLRVDHRADLYALAAIVYRCLTGRYPFTAPDTPALLYAVVHRMPAKPSALADVHVDVDRWCAIALAKDPSSRFATGAEQTAALAQALAGTLSAKLRKHGDALIRKHPWEAA